MFNPISLAEVYTEDNRILGGNSVDDNTDIYQENHLHRLYKSK